MSISTTTFFVSAGTGSQGGAALDYLRQAAPEAALRTMSRDPHSDAALKLQQRGVTVHGGDWSDRDALRRALEGVTAMFLHTTSFDLKTMQADQAKEIEQGGMIVDAAREQGVRHIVFSTSPFTGMVPHMDSKRAIERQIEASGITYTFVSTCNYMDNFLFWPVYKPALENGTLIFRLPFPAEAILPTISVKDIGIFAGIALLQPERFRNTKIEVSGSEETMPAMVGIFSAVTGKRAAYRTCSPDEWKRLWPLYSDEMANMFAWYAKGVKFTDLARSREIHPQVESWEDWLRRTGWNG